MGNSRFNGLWVIVITFIVALILMMMRLPNPLPWQLGYLRPDWVGLVLFYWAIALPRHVGIISAWMLGISVDVLVGSLLGQHCISMMFIVYVASKLHQRLRMFAIWQQSLMVFVIIGGARLINILLEYLLGISEWHSLYLLPAFISALLWPLVFMVLRSLRRFFGVH